MADEPAQPPPDRETDSLAAALERHCISLSAEQVALVDQYVRLLWDWNAKLNLTRHTTFDKIVGRDVVDARQLAAHLETGERVLDVGTGGGMPGVLLAILRPDVTVAVCDSVGKKARAVADMVSRLGLDIAVHAARVQELVEQHPQDTLVMRGVGRMAKVLGWLEPHWSQFGRLLLVKGPSWLDERKEARDAGRLRGLELRRQAAYPLLGTDNTSVILEIRRREEP